MPDETPSTPSTSTPKSTTRGRGATPRPRAGIQRKTKAERDQFAKEEAERQKARAAEQGAANRGTRGGRAVTRSGRGGTSPPQREGPVGRGGVFGAGTGFKATPKAKYEGYAELLDGEVRGGGVEDSMQDGSAAGEGAAAGVKGTGPAKTSTGGKAAETKTVETLETITDDELDDEPKRDIERIWISSDEDDDIITSTSRKGKQKATSATTQRASRAGQGLRPVRAPRIIREEEEQDGDIPTSRGKKSRASAAASRKSDPELQELSSDDSRDSDAMDVDTDSVQFVKERPSNLETRRRTLKKQSAITSKYGREAKASANETIEERAERLRMQDDVEQLRDIFVSKASTKDNTEDDDEPLTSRSDGKLFLFQLPPLTPFLVDPTAASAEQPEVKTEPSNDANGATIDLDNIPDAPPPTTDPEVKVDPDGPSTMKSSKKLQMNGLLTASEPMRLPSGIVGKLNVHKSGKVTLDWGGTDMEVRLGSNVDFLQDVVLVQPPNKDENGAMNVDEEEEDGEENLEKERKGRAYALGQVRKKMVLIPDWAKLYD